MRTCDCFLDNFCNKCFPGNTFSVSWSFILWAFNIIQNFQNMFITRGTCDSVLGNICQQLLPWQHFFCIVFKIVILWVLGNTFSCFLGLKIFLWVLCIPNPMATLYIFLGPI